ncbi:MAG TPA: mandelate racemase/muconate lactonizing enzyme family protein [Thermoleophilaceae bacterium]|nr:mandelate racemase/muconate lactonizing enzyme family protein [Thermoleophilaceae bacterium]
MTKIVGIDVTPVSIPFAIPERWAFGEHSGMTTLIVELRTDSGLVGLGEVVPAGPGPKTLMGAIEELTPLLIGRDARDVNRNVARMTYAGGWYMFPRTGNLVVAGLEMAMWDVLGKSVGEPLHRLFGGAVRDRLPYVYWLMATPSLPDMVEEAVWAARKGFTSFFFKGGWDERRDLELVAALRERLGPDVKLRLDVNEAWTVGTAKRMLAKLEPYDLEFVEQPVRMDDVDALLRLREASRVPIGANQSSWTAKQIFEIAKRGAADAVVTDPHQEGGLSGLRKSLAICEVAGIPVAHHSFSGLTIAMTAAMHVNATTPNSILAGQACPPGYIQGDVTTSTFTATDGFAELPSGPGIGVDLDPDRLATAHEAYLRDELHPFFGGGGDIEWMPSR